MTNDMKFPEEIKQDQWKLILDRLHEYHKDKPDDDYCECHTKCPKCGKKYRKPVYSNTDVKG